MNGSHESGGKVMVAASSDAWSCVWLVLCGLTNLHQAWRNVHPVNYVVFSLFIPI